MNIQETIDKKRKTLRLIMSVIEVLQKEVKKGSVKTGITFQKICNELNKTDKTRNWNSSLLLFHLKDLENLRLIDRIKKADFTTGPKYGTIHIVKNNWRKTLK